MMRSSFYVDKHVSASMAGEHASANLIDPLDPNISMFTKGIIDEADNEGTDDLMIKDMDNDPFSSLLPLIERPRDMKAGVKELKENYTSTFFTLLYNGFGLNAKEIIMRTNDKPDRPDYGASLANVIFGVRIESQSGFKQITEDLNSFSFPEITNTVDVLPITTTQSELIPTDPSQELMKRFVAESQRKTRLDFAREIPKVLEFETEESSKAIKSDGFMFDNEDIDGIEKRSAHSSNHSERAEAEKPSAEIKRWTSKSDDDYSNKDAYVYIHTNYKGELKDERFTAFLLMKINESIIQVFDQMIIYVKKQVNQLKVIKLSGEESVEQHDKTVEVKSSSKNFCKDYHTSMRDKKSENESK